MRGIAKFLTLVTVIVLLACGYVIWASELSVSSAGAVIESAADRADAFESIRQMSEVGSTDIVMFRDGVEGEAADYSFVTYTLRVRNLNLLDAEWLQLELSSADGDVLMLKPTVEDVAALNEQYLSVVLMTNRLTNSYTRSATLTYYVYGHAVSIPVQLTA